MNNSPVEIRDIQLPDGVDIFPLSYGWWVLIGGIIIAFLVIKLLLWGIKTSKKYYALKELKSIDTSKVVEAGILVSLLLRRICNVKYKEASVLYGEEWLDFLKKRTKAKLSEGGAFLLLFAPFMNKEEKKYTKEDADNLISFCKTWIGDNL